MTKKSGKQRADNAPARCGRRSIRPDRMTEFQAEATRSPGIGRFGESVETGSSKVGDGSVSSGVSHGIAYP